MTLSVIIVALAVVGFLYWILSAPSKKSTPIPHAPLINPDDSYQIGLLCGMSGSTVPEAAVMRFALENFQKNYGRPATTQDIGIVLGLIK